MTPSGNGAVAAQVISCAIFCPTRLRWREAPNSFLQPAAMLEILTNFLTYIPFYVYALGLAFAGCVFYQKTCHFSFTEELTVRDNPAFGVCLAGYLVGLVIALAAAFP